MKYFPPFRLDRADRSLWRGRERVSLTQKALTLLECLVNQAGRPVPRASILEAVWPDTHVHPDNVKVLVREIRLALGDVAAAPRFIRSASAGGYEFIAVVTDEPSGLPEPIAAPLLVGRDRELARLDTELAAAAAGDRRIVLVSGEGGIGKSTLCEAFLNQASTGQALRIMWCNCFESTGPVEPYSPLLDALTRLGSGPASPLLATTLARFAPSWVPHLPALFDVQERASHANGGEPPGGQRMVREIASAIEALAQDVPIVWWVEDLQWADPATLDVIAHLGVRRDPGRVFVLSTIRHREPGSHHPAERVSADLVMRGRAIEMPLQPLQSADVSAYLERRFGHSELAALAPIIYRATDGHPLFMVTAVDHMVSRGFFAESAEGWRLAAPSEQIADEVPGTLAVALSRHLEALDPVDHHALAAAAVVGHEFSLFAASAAAQLDDAALERTLESLARRRAFIARQGVATLPGGLMTPCYRFIHNAHREALLERLGAIECPRAHQRVGLAMERLFKGSEQLIAIELASHFHAALDQQRAARYLQLAAGNAIRRHALREAAALLREAVEESSASTSMPLLGVEQDVLRDLVRVQEVIGSQTADPSTLERLEQRALQLENQDDRLQAFVNLAEAHVGSSRARVLHFAQLAAEARTGSSDDVLTAESTIRSGLLTLYVNGWADVVADECVDALSLMRSMKDVDHLRVTPLTARLMFVQCLRSEYIDAWRTGRRALQVLRRRDDVPDSLICYYSLAGAALHLGRFHDALRMIDLGVALAERAGGTIHAATMRLHNAWLCTEAQQWDDAYRMAVRERPVVDAAGWANGMQMSRLFAGIAALGQDRIDVAQQELEFLRDWHARERIILDWYWKIPLHLALTELALRTNDVGRARMEADTALDAANATPERTWRSRVHVTRAEVAMARGQFNEAESELRRARREVLGLTAPLATWRIDATAATLHAEMGRPSAAGRARARSRRVVNRLDRGLARAGSGPAATA